jgi:phosphate acetyltransferase
MNSDLQHEWLQNHTFDELSIGQSAKLQRLVTEADIAGFAAVSGDLNPTHLDDAYARGEGLRGKTAHGMWSGAMISTLMGTVFPGPGTVYVEQRMRFLAPACAGDRLEIIATVKAKDASNGHVTMDCVVRRVDGKDLMLGEAIVRAPAAQAACATRQRPALACV